MSQPEYLDHTSPAISTQPRKGRRRVPVLGVLGVVAVAGAGLASVQLGVLGASGPQPDQFVPSTAVAYAALDLDPSAKEKVDAHRFLSKFDGLDVTDSDSLKSRLSEELGDDASWVGDRVAVAAIPNPDSKSGVTPFVVAQFDDDSAMRETLDGVNAAKRTGYRVLDGGYALIAESDAEVEAVAAALGQGVLADDAAYAADVAGLSEDRFGTIWVDVEAAGEAARAAAESTGEPIGLEGLADVSGSMVAALEFSSDSVALTGRSTVKSASVPVPAASSTAKIADLPADTDVAVAVSGLGEGLAKAWSAVTANDTLGLVESAADMGLVLPGDLLAVFGTDFAVGAELTTPALLPDSVVAAARTDDADRVQELAEVLGADAPNLTVHATTDGYRATWGTPGEGSLTETDAYRRAVDGDPTAVLFVNLTGLRDGYGDAGLDADAQAFLDTAEAVAAYTTFDGTGQRFTVRLTAP